MVVDLGSTNGTELNGRRVTREKLADGDRITIGATDVVFGRPGSRDVIGALDTEQTLLALKIGFLVLLYLFIWMVVRSVTRDLRSAPQESIVLSATEASQLLRRATSRSSRRPSHACSYSTALHCRRERPWS